MKRGWTYGLSILPLVSLMVSFWYWLNNYSPSLTWVLLSLVSISFVALSSMLFVQYLFTRPKQVHEGVVKDDTRTDNTKNTWLYTLLSGSILLSDSSSNSDSVD